MGSEKKEKITQYGRNKIDSKNRAAKSITKKFFQEEWDKFYIENNVDSEDSEDIAREFFYKGIVEGISFEDKDYKKLKEKRKIDEMSRLKAERMVREVKGNLFKIGKNGKLNIRKAIDLLVMAKKDNEDNELFVKLIDDEIRFLERYKTDRNGCGKK